MDSLKDSPLFRKPKKPKPIKRLVLLCNCLEDDKTCIIKCKLEKAATLARQEYLNEKSNLDAYVEKTDNKK